MSMKLFYRSILYSLQHTKFATQETQIKATARGVDYRSPPN